MIEDMPIEERLRLALAERDIALSEIRRIIAVHKVKCHLCADAIREMEEKK